MDTQHSPPPPPQTTIESGGGDGKPHVLVVPFPAQGHMLAHLDLAALLATRGDLSVTVAVTTGNAALLDPLLAACPSIGVVTLPFPSSPFLPPGCCAAENTRELPYHLFRMFLPALAALRAPLLAWCKAQAQTRRVTAVVSDLFAGWARPLADEIGALHATFSPCSALYVAMSRPLWRRMPRRSSGAADDDDVALSPAVSFPWRQLPTIYRHHEDGDEASEAIRQILLWSLESECVVVNSFAALEATYLELEPRVLAVDPLSEAWAHSGNRGGRPAVAAAEVCAWLDAFPPGSVVYVSFGTQHALSPEQAARVAGALERSSAPFVWAVGSAAAALPEGFEAAARGRGLVIRGWAPQVEILRHAAVGWFLTHCGMNAALEAAAASVAVLAWPMGADHFVNRVLLREAGVAVDVAEGADAGQMAEAIAAALGDEGKPFRERAAELGRKAAAAVAEGGSSHRDFQELVRMLAKVH
ncbi:unnamed protein product [Urochloa humidicola]